MGDIEELGAVADIRNGRPLHRSNHHDDDDDNDNNNENAIRGDASNPSTTSSAAAVHINNARSAVPRSGADVPGDATVYVHTFGCGHNVSDSEYMSGQLFKAGYRITDEFSAADCYLINSCTVKNPSEDHFVTLVRKAKATLKPVICAGCVPAGDPKGAEWRDVSVIGVRQIHRVCEVVAESLRGNTVRLFDSAEQLAASKQRGGRNASAASGAADSVPVPQQLNEAVGEVKQLPSLLLPKVRRNRFIEIIPINVGCLNFCTYCKTKHARGDLQSWPVSEIVQRVKDSIAEGVVEIHLTSEDTGAYGIDLGTNIVVLLQAILAVLEGTPVMCRLGMTNPPYLLRHLDEIGPLFTHKNMFEFVHIPVQSGSDVVLAEMKREYTVAEFKRCVRRLQHHCPRMMLATDIICAFPNEGEAEWQETLALCREIRFPVLNISRFYPRRGTLAAAAKQVPTEIAKRRTQELSQFFNEETSVVGSSSGSASYLPGSEHHIWVTDVAHDKHHLIGHTKQFVQVLLDPVEGVHLGDFVHVKLTDEVMRFCAKGNLIKVLHKRSSAPVSLTPAPRQLQNAAVAADDDDGVCGSCGSVESMCGGDALCNDNKAAPLIAGADIQNAPATMTSRSYPMTSSIAATICVSAVLGGLAWWCVRHVKQQPSRN